MFARLVGTEIVDAQLSTEQTRLYSSATRDNAHRRLLLKLVNATSVTYDMKIDLKGTRAVSPAELITLTGIAPNTANTIYQKPSIFPATTPERISSADLYHSLQPYSINVLELSY